MSWGWGKFRANVASQWSENSSSGFTRGEECRDLTLLCKRSGSAGGEVCRELTLLCKRSGSARGEVCRELTLLGKRSGSAKGQVCREGSVTLPIFAQPLHSSCRSTATASFAEPLLLQNHCNHSSCTTTPLAQPLQPFLLQTTGRVERA